MKTLISIFLLTMFMGCTEIPDAARDIDGIEDIDGNIYHSVIIGTQEWMTENLKVTHMNDGTDIKNETDDTKWKDLKVPAWCWYYNIPNTDGTKGILYNWYAVNTDKLCPDGWHVSSDQEWKTFEIFLGMTILEADDITWRGEGFGTDIKAIKGWYELSGIHDPYGFSALPAGARHGYAGDFFDYMTGAYWWTSTKFNKDNSWFRSIMGGETSIFRETIIKSSGFSVRCLKNMQK